MRLLLSATAFLMTFATFVSAANGAESGDRRLSPGSLRSASNPSGLSPDLVLSPTLNSRDGNIISDLFNGVIGGGGGAGDPISVVLTAATSLIGNLLGEITGLGQNGGIFGAILGGSGAKGIIGSVGGALGMHRRGRKIDHYGPLIDKLEGVLDQLKIALAAHA